MRILPIAAVLALLAAAGTARAGFLVQPNDVVAICGDSITERLQYSPFVEDYLLMCQPTPGQRIAQFGWSGETAAGFHLRLQSDLFPFKPTVVTTCYGMNDGGYRAVEQGTLDAYRNNMAGVVADLKKGGVRAVVVGTPGCVDSTTFKHTATAPEVYNETLRSLGDVAKDVSRQQEVDFADVHGPMMDAMAKAKAAYGDAYVFAGPDGVHPGPNGGLVMAYALLKGLGCDGNIGTITLDLASDTGEATPGHKIVSLHSGVAQIESVRYPFCFAGQADKPESTPASVAKFTAFNDDLNRFLLVVKGLKIAKAKVTWSSSNSAVSVSQVFSAEDLAKGVNLAAAFVGQNPFSDAFSKVHGAVQAQQAAESPLVKTFLHGLPQFKTYDPADAAAFDRAAAAAIEQDNTLFQTAVNDVVPVRHTLTVEPAP